MKKYLDCQVQKKSGGWFRNPLKLSEAHFVSQLAQNNSKVEVSCIECTPEYYKNLFG